MIVRKSLAALRRGAGPLWYAVMVLAVGACASSPGAAGGGFRVEGPPHNAHSQLAQQELALAMIQAGGAAEAHYRNALAAAMESIATDPDNANGWLLAGQAYVGLEDYAAADSVFTRAEELFPPFAEEVAANREMAWAEAYNQGAEAYDAGRTADAILHFENADRIYGEYPDQRVVLGFLYTQLGRIEDAADAYLRAVAIYARGTPDGLDDQQTADWMSNRDMAFLEAGRLLSFLDRHREAADVYRTFLTVDPDNVEAQVQLAVALADGGDAHESLAMLEALRTRADLDEDQQFTLGVGFFEAERYDLAAEIFKRAVDVNPESRDAAYNLAQALFLMAAALEDAHEAATQDSEREALEAQLAEVFADLRDAAAVTRRLDPYNRDVLVLLARGYQGLAATADDFEDAREWSARTEEILELHAALPFEILDVAMFMEGDQLMVGGTLENIDLDPGAVVRVNFTLVGDRGRAVSTGQVSIDAPARGEAIEFRLPMDVDDQPRGWKYEIVN